jgi:hypothetical protein
MRLLSTTAFAALLLSTTVAMSALAANPRLTGCDPGARKAEAEGGGVGSAGQVTRQAEAEGGGVGSAGQVTRKAEAEGGGGVGSTGQATGTQIAAADSCK